MLTNLNGKKDSNLKNDHEKKTASIWCEWTHRL